MRDYVIADVFTESPLHGNPVATFLAADGLTAERMQRIAREMNLSETTFVMRPRATGDVWVRIFTPVNELPFAGHPTLGTAVAIASSAEIDELVMETAMGLVPFTFHRADGVVTGRMRQPIPTWNRYEFCGELLEALDLSGSTLPVEVYRNGPRHVFVGLPDVSALSALRPDHRALSDHLDVAVNCFAPASDGTHWRMRMFSPAYGVVEDAATGSAAGPLAVHLARHGSAPFGQQIEIMQGVEIDRRSRMYAEANGGPDHLDSVYVSGCAVVVGRGTLNV